jgi:hypothetical protein
MGDPNPGGKQALRQPLLEAVGFGQIPCPPDSDKSQVRAMM